jgi:phage shock protein A
MDKKRLQEKDQAYTQQIEQVRKELEAQREREKELQKKIEGLENNPMMMAQASTKNVFRKIPIVATPINAA